MSLAHPTTSSSPLAGTGAVLGARACAGFSVLWFLWGWGAVPSPWAFVGGAVTILAALATMGRLRHQGGHPHVEREKSHSYRTIVISELAIAFIGGLVLANTGNQELVAGWIALVVGVHFFALARLWPGSTLSVLGALVSAAGIAGIVVGLATGSIDAGTATAALATGALLLGSAGTVAARL